MTITSPEGLNSHFESQNHKSHSLVKKKKKGLSECWKFKKVKTKTKKKRLR